MKFNKYFCSMVFCYKLKNGINQLNGKKDEEKKKVKTSTLFHDKRGMYQSKV